MKVLVIAPRCRVGTGFLLLTFAALCASAATPKRVLILDSFGRDVTPFSVAVSAFRTSLARDLGQPVDIYEAPLDMARFADSGFEKPLVDFLEQRFADSPIDLVVPFGAPAVRFAAKHRKRLFAETPIVFVGAEPRTLPPDALETNATLVTQKNDLPGMIEDILQLQPDTTNIVVVFGVSPIEQFWAGECRREWQVFTNRVGFSWLDTLSLQQMQERARKLPPRSFIVVPLLVMDADRVPYDGYEAFEAIHAAANAPLFGYYRSQLGRGAIGGRLHQDSKVGTEAAKVAIRILRGERATDIPPEIMGSSPPTYDWRELTRWGISPNRLPAGSVIEFREPTSWQRYRWRMVGVVAFCCLQTALIIGLIVNWAKRREEQAAATLIADLSSRFVHLPAGEIDRQIEEAQRLVCGSLDLDVATLWQWSSDNQWMLRLTHLYRPLRGPPVPELMDAQESFPWCQRQVLAGNMVVVSSLADLPPEAARDREVWDQYGIKTTLTIPLSAGGGPVFGCVSFNDMKAERHWSGALVQRLQLVAQIFANALARKVADQALRESEARLSLAADAAAVGLWSLNVVTDRYWVTDKTRELFQFTPSEEVTFERFLSLVHPDDRSLVCETVRTMVQSRSEGQVQYRAIRPDGSVRWMLSRGRVRCAASGEPEYLMGVTTDITQRKQAETAVRESVERFRQVAELAGEFIWETDANGLYTYASPSVEKILGYTPAELVGRKRFYELFDPSVREELKAAAFRVFTDRQTFRDFPNPNLSKSGKLVHLETSGMPILDAAGKLTGYRGTDTDVTARREAEAEAQRSRQELAHVSRVSTLGELAASLAHELSQPLGAILRNTEAAELMLKTASPDLEELRAIITDIHNDDQRAAHVIDRLRLLLRRGSLALQPVDINMVIAEVLLLVHADAAVRHVKLKHVAAPGVPRVRGDRVHLQQVLLNLLLNAMDALAGVAAHNRSIRIASQRADGGGVEVRVCDNGHGIPDESLERLFEPFFTTKPHGMGMGLPVSKSIIEAHQGTIWAENRPEGGACFCFTLPVAVEGRKESS